MKVHLLLKKEEIDQAQMDDRKVAVVFDVLLATSTITACLHFGANQVIPVLNEEEALQEASRFRAEEAVLVGEYNGITIDGFLNPAPLALKDHVSEKTVVLSTTNGTVAIKKSAAAKEVYVASILNGMAVSKAITEQYVDETIMVVCSGSKDRFCMEDFYGAGFFISRLASMADESIELTDSALAAKLFYENSKGRDVLHQSRVGRMLGKYGDDAEIDFINQEGVLPVVPYLTAGKVIQMENSTVARKSMTGEK